MIWGFKQIPLSSSVKELIGHSLPPLLEMYESEDNKLVTSIITSRFLVLVAFGKIKHNVIGCFFFRFDSAPPAHFSDLIFPSLDLLLTGAGLL